MFWHDITIEDFWIHHIEMLKTIEQQSLCLATVRVWNLAPTHLVASGYFLALVLFSKVITTRLSKCPRRRRTCFGLGTSTQTRPETLSLGAVELLDLPSAISQNPHHSFLGGSAWGHDGWGHDKIDGLLWGHDRLWQCFFCWKRRKTNQKNFAASRRWRHDGWGHDKIGDFLWGHDVMSVMPSRGHDKETMRPIHGYPVRPFDHS